MSQRTQAVPPSTEQTAFSCPHCGAPTTQYWRRTLVAHAEKDKLPLRVRDIAEARQRFRAQFSDEAEFKQMMAYVEQVATGLPTIGDEYNRAVRLLNNVDVSQCYNCDRLALWVHNEMAWPHPSEAPQPNADLPDDAVADYEEAGQIVGRSPRGAAALLRLVIQKLCKDLGGTGENLNTDIKALVARGLDPRVQQALDVVRVIGNNAVHPGQIDLRDDRSTADKLFSLVNLICDVMISQPKHIKEMFDALPEAALAQIQRRDNPDTGST